MKNETEILEETVTELQLNDWPKEVLKTSEPSKVDIFKAFDAIPRTELTTAQTIAAKYRHRLSYVSYSKTWYLWDGMIHRPCKGDDIAQKVMQSYFITITSMVKIADEAIKTQHGDDPEKAKGLKAELEKHKSFRNRVATTQGQRAIIDQLRTCLDVADDYYADDRRWFVVRNGVFDMDEVRATKQFSLKKHDASRPVYRMWDIENNDTADYPQLRRFLNESIEDRGQGIFFGKAVALACMGAPIATRTIVSLQGAPRTGKSMINRAISRLTGGNGVYTEPPRDAIVKNGRNPNHARYTMQDARYVAFTEITDELDREFVLKYTGGDEYPVEQKYIAGTQVKPQGIIFMASNHGMSISKTDEAIFERLAPINFPRTFEKITEDGTHILDPDLEDKIVAEGSGFLNWMKWCYLEWMKEGLDRTESMDRLKREEREDETSVFQYIADRVDTKFLTINPDAPLAQCASVTLLYADYLEWCKGFGVPKSSQLKRGQFSKELDTKYPKDEYQTVRFTGLVMARS